MCIRDRCASRYPDGTYAIACDAVPGAPSAEVCDSVDDLLERTLVRAGAGDVVVTMSSGSFGQLPRRLLERLG